MLNSRKIVRAFLASPGDLEEERKAIRDVVDEFNESWANELGYQIELVGWEETVAGFGRPQHLINKDLDRCDLFIGMIWKRWGTPPDLKGEFSSGFEEEFSRSLARCEQSGSPEISLFFKQVPKEFMVDPGPDLKRVNQFRDKIIAEKKIYFQNFSTLRDVEALARKCITSYINRLRAEDNFSEPEEIQSKRVRTDSEEINQTDKHRASSPLSNEGLKFLEFFVESIRHPNSLETLNASDIARFRLLANTISKPGNEEMNVGVHDINILFAARDKGMKLGAKEKQSLVRLGFQHLANENVPLWCWYSELTTAKINPAVVSSMFGINDSEKVGAISVLTALALDISANKGLITKSRLLESWFADGASTSVRTAALEYLAKCGTTGDLEVVRSEFDKSDYGTSRSALECMVAILLRTGQTKSAREILLESQFGSLDGNLLASVLSDLEEIDTSTLLLGLDHRNSQVRLSSMKALHNRGSLQIDRTERLLGDSNALIRAEAVQILLKSEKPLDKDDVKRILLPPETKHRSGLLGLAMSGDSNERGEELFREYELALLKSLPQDVLEKKVSSSLMYDDAAYFALVSKYFKSCAEKLRRDVDDKFKECFEKRIQRMRNYFGDGVSTDDLVKKTRAIEEYTRKDLTRQGLNVLCLAQDAVDLKRIRANLRDGYAGASKLDAEYLRKHGDWTDITILANAKAPTLGTTSFLASSDDEDYRVEAARAINAMGKGRPISDLLAIEMPASILKKVIELSAETRFAKISQELVLELLNHESEDVRKTAAILSVRAFPAKRIKSILHEYVGSDDYRYYNVIHWLDLGASMTRDEAKTVARSACL